MGGARPSSSLSLPLSSLPRGPGKGSNDDIVFLFGFRSHCRVFGKLANMGIQSRYFCACDCHQASDGWYGGVQQWCAKVPEAFYRTPRVIKIAVSMKQQLEEHAVF